MIVDVNAFVGAYPFHPSSGTPDDLLRAMDRAGIDAAWVSHLPSLWWSDPMEGHDAFFALLAGSDRLRPVPSIHPGLPRWCEAIDQAVAREVPAIRCDPVRFGLDVGGGSMGELVDACCEAGLPLVLGLRLEDARQRHPLDVASDLEPWAIRTLLRCAASLRLVVTGADRDAIEQVHFGSTPEESRRVWWDIAWVWGPPEDHLAALLETVGGDRFLFGTGQPLRLPEATVAKLDLLEPQTAGRWRRAIESENLDRLAATR